MIDVMNMSAAKEYKLLADNRSSYLSRAESASKLTVPQLYPEGDTPNKTYSTPYQSLGARGVNNLANKIILSLFPPATAFFKLGANQLAKEQSGISDGDLQTAMQIVEKGIVNEMEVSQLRSVLVDVIKQCIVGGSSVIYIPEEDRPRSYTLKQMGVKRTRSGALLKLILKESVNYLELPQDVRDELEDLDDKELDGSKDMDLFTMVVLGDNGDYQAVQEIKGKKIKGTKAVYKAKELPYIFVPFVDRQEDYGRSYIEDFLGDLLSYEGLRQSILEAAAESARIIYLIKPNAVLAPKKLSTARSGDVLLGNRDDVSTLQADKSMDLRIAQTEADILRRDLGTIFLLDSSVTRNAERVTAEEIRRVSQELEVALGGIYSTLANVVQEPLVRVYLKRLVKRGLIKDILKDNLELEITTGSAALGRGTEFNAISTYLTSASQLVGPEQFMRVVNVSEALSRMAYSLDINTGDLIKSEEQLKQEEQQAQQNQLEQQAVAPTINAVNQQELADKG